MTKNVKLVTPDAIAAELNIDAKTVRKHLRVIVDLHNAKYEDEPEKQIEKPGRGGAWAVGIDMIDAVKERVESRQSGRSVTLTADMLS